MVAVTVRSCEKGVERVETLDVNLETTTVAAFRQELSVLMEWRSFNLYFKLAVGRRLLKKDGDDPEFLSSVGVIEDSVFQLVKQKTAAQWQHFRLESGVTKTLRVTRKIDKDVEAIGKDVKDMGKAVEDVGGDVKEVVGILRGEAGPRREGMTAAARMEQNRISILALQSEKRKLREEMDDDKERKKIERSEAVEQAASAAQEAVDVAVGNLDGEDMEQKMHILKEQMSTLAEARRKLKTKERRAAAKAKVAAKPKAGRKKRGRAEEAVGQGGMEVDQDHNVEAANLQEELEMRLQFQAIDEVATAQGAAASSSDAAPAPGAGSPQLP